MSILDEVDYTQVEERVLSYMIDTELPEFSFRKPTGYEQEMFEAIYGKRPMTRVLNVTYEERPDGGIDIDITSIGNKSYGNMLEIVIKPIGDQWLKSRWVTIHDIPIQSKDVIFSTMDGAFQDAGFDIKRTYEEWT